MKALVILNTILEDEEYEDMECVASCFTKTYFKTAIAELKALQQRTKSLEAQLANTDQLTCDGCKWEKDESAIVITCSKCARNIWVDHYQPKNTK